MASLNDENMIYDVKLSSVVPGNITAKNTVHELGNLDLVMKLHYLKGVYYFNRDAVEGLTIKDFKFPMFEWLGLYTSTSGRIRISDSGRPFIKCNDSGVRIIEARCSMTLEDCLRNKDLYVHNQLFPDQVLGPEMSFSPLLLIQFTWFKCGGMAVGLSWAHILGDVFSASNFINIWGQIVAKKLPLNSLNPKPKAHYEIEKSGSPRSNCTELLSIKKIEDVNKSWIVRNNCWLKTFSFQLTATQLKHLCSKISNQCQTPVFETLCGIIWHCLAKIRGDAQAREVSTCRHDYLKREVRDFGNNQIIGTVSADFSVIESEPSELAALIVRRLVDESSAIEDVISRDEQGLSDFIVYGANLTFVDFEYTNLYGLELKGQKPVFTNYSIDGVGEKGVVLVLPGPEWSDGRGRTVTLVLPENEVLQLRNMLEDEWDIII